MNITHANTEDIPQLCDLLDTLFTQELEFKTNRQAQVQGLSEIIKHPDMGTIIIARESEKILAMANLLYTVSTALGGRVALLEDMIVHADARGSGIGSQLIDYTIKFAIQNNCKRITLLTDHNNQPAHQFYRKHGFIESSMLTFRHSLIEE